MVRPHDYHDNPKRMKQLERQKRRRKKKKEKKGAHIQKQADKVSGFYKSDIWARLRYDALQANAVHHGVLTCDLCGRTKKDGVVMQVDHIKPVRKFWGLRMERTNLQVLCSTCNWGKGNRDDTDWREPDLKVLMGERIS